MLLHLAFLVFQGPAQEAEARVVEYLRRNIRPGEPVVVSELLNDVFKEPAERAALSRLFDAFFKIPLFVVEYQAGADGPPTLTEISERFHFEAPGTADVLLRVLASDPRLPKFLERDPRSGEITRVDAEAVKAHPRFGKAHERTLTGLEGTEAPSFSITGFDSSPLAAATLVGKPHLLYFWFTNCPPCVRIAPLLVELREAHVRQGFEIVGINADRVLEVPVDDAERTAYAKEVGIRFPLAHATPEVLAAYGQVSVFPTLVFVDRRGKVVKQLVNFQTKAVLEEALQLTLR